MDVPIFMDLTVDQLRGRTPGEDVGGPQQLSTDSWGPPGGPSLSSPPVPLPEAPAVRMGVNSSAPYARARAKSAKPPPVATPLPKRVIVRPQSL